MSTIVAQIDGRIATMANRQSSARPFCWAPLTCLSCGHFLHGPAHGHHIGKHIQRKANDFLQMQHGSLYLALHRLTEKGRKQLLVEESQWKRMTEAVARVMWPAAEEI